MTVAITLPPSPPPTREDPANFAVRADAHHAWLVPAVAQMNDQNAENNSINANISAKRDELIAAGLQNAAANAVTATTQATAALGHANNAAASASTAGAAAVTAAGHATSAGSAATSAAQVLIGAVTQRPALRPSLSVDWTLKPTAAALTAAGWTISRAGEMTYFGAVPVKVAENLFFQSQNFGDASWNKTLRPVVVSAVTHPSGLAGYNLAATADSGQHGLCRYQNEGTFLPGQTYRIRVLAKQSAYSKLLIADDSSGRAGAQFDLSSGTVIGAGLGPGYISHSIAQHELAGGLYWCELVLTATSVGNWRPVIIGYPDSGATVSASTALYTGDGTSGIEVYAAQLQHNFDGDYVPTTDVPITQYASPLLTAAANELAYQHNSRGECIGLLQYPADTNLILQSQTLSTSWATVRTLVSVTKRLWAAYAPFWRVAKADAAASASVFQSLAGTYLAGTKLTMTFAALGCRWSGNTSMDFGISAGSGDIWGAVADWSFATISGPGTAVRPGAGTPCRVTGLSFDTPTVIRATRTFTADAVNPVVRFYPGFWDSVTVGQAILVTRVHLSAAPRYMPYIPTTTAAVTRGTQSITLGTVSGGNPLGPAAFASACNPVEGTLLSRASVEDVVFGDFYSTFWLNYQGQVPWRHGIYSTAAGQIHGVTSSYGASQAALTVGVNFGTTQQTAAYSYSATLSQLAAAATPSTTDIAAVMPILDRASVGGWIGLIQRTELYPRAMTSAELSAITTPGVLV